MAEEAEIVTHPIASHQSGAIVKIDEQKGQRPRFFFLFFFELRASVFNCCVVKSPPGVIVHIIVVEKESRARKKLLLEIFEIVRSNQNDQKPAIHVTTNSRLKCNHIFRFIQF
jgi:hypothetical protein